MCGVVVVVVVCNQLKDLQTVDHLKKKCNNALFMFYSGLSSDQVARSPPISLSASFIFNCSAI